MSNATIRKILEWLVVSHGPPLMRRGPRIGDIPLLLKLPGIRELYQMQFLPVFSQLSSLQGKPWIQDQPAISLLPDLLLFPFRFVQGIPYGIRLAVWNTRIALRSNARRDAQREAGRPGVPDTAAARELERQFSELDFSSPTDATAVLERFLNQELVQNGPAYYRTGATFMFELMPHAANLSARASALRHFIDRFDRDADPGSTFWVIPAAWVLAMTLADSAHSDGDKLKVEEALRYVDFFLVRYRAFNPLYREELLTHVSLLHTPPNIAEHVTSFSQYEAELLSAPKGMDLSATEALIDKNFLLGLRAALQSDVQARATTHSSEPFALILRGFEPEASKIHVPDVGRGAGTFITSSHSGWTDFENRFASQLMQVIRVVTVANPVASIADAAGESRALVPRLVLSDQWLDEVRDLIRRARFILMFGGRLPLGVLLEMREIVEMGKADVTVLVIPGEEGDLQRLIDDDLLSGEGQERATLLAQFRRVVTQAAIATSDHPLDLPVLDQMLRDVGLARVTAAANVPNES